MNKELFNLKRNQIMQNFDFYKVAKIMEILEWHYFDNTNSPTVYELRNTANELFDEAEKDKREIVYVETGGFKVTKDKDGLSLEFIVEEFSS